MAITLKDLVTAYLADSQWQKDKQQRTEVRTLALPQVSALARDFANGTVNLEMFYQRLNESFKTTGERWGAQGNSFTLPLIGIARQHDSKEPVAEPKLRKLITDLDASNMGERIERLYVFLLEERARLRQENKHASEAGKSPMIISLFAFWLHPEQEPIIYHEGVRHGLGLLVKRQLIAPSPGLNVDRDVAKVLTNNNHKAFIATIDALLKVYPQLHSSPYWSEFFFYWVVDYFETHNQSAQNQPTLIIEQDEGGILAPGHKHAMADHSSEVNNDDSPPQPIITIADDPLMPTPEPLLSELIREVQRHILVEESVIRRIYHALLAGHVILSGPPGTGKTELARLIPETLWQRPENEENDYDPEEIVLTKSTAYTTSLVTATDEWSVRTLISGIAPVSKDGNVSYSVKYGYLTNAIQKNWSALSENPDKWGAVDLPRSQVTSSGGVERGIPQTFRGQWLVIDEFNRAPIDLALGDALTALGGNDVLRVAIEGGSAELPIPKDFRIIGTLNSFDRNYLNQISEALKRRFSFVEILPPGRSLREAEKAIVLYKALERTSHLSRNIVAENDIITWETITIEAEPEGSYIITWPDDGGGFFEAFEVAWCLLEIIRIYRQLGTAQAISLVRHMLIAGILQGYTTRNEWMSALDAALCDTIADQLQVLLPDEIDALLLTLTHTHNKFRETYNRLLAGLADRPQRLYGQLLALGRVNDENGVPYLTDEEVETIAQSNQPTITPEKLDDLFHLLSFNKPALQLPQFTRRLRAFKAERGL
jgi:DNA polymerase III delta prime subunit